MTVCMLSEDVRKNIKKLLCSMEGNPEQIAAYFRSIRESPDREETMSYAWEVIRKCFDEESIMLMENAGLSPVSSPRDEDGDRDDAEREYRRRHFRRFPPDDDKDYRHLRRRGPDADREEEEEDDDEDDDTSFNPGDEEEDGDGEDSGKRPGDDDDEDGGGNDDEPDDGEDNREDDSDTGSGEPDTSDIPDGGDGTDAGREKDDDGDDAGPEDAPLEKEPDILAGISIPPAQQQAIVPPEPAPPVMPVTPVGQIAKGIVEDDPSGRTIRLPNGAGTLPPGPVYVIPADTGREAEIRIMELRVSTDENLRLAYKIHEEIARSVAEEHKIRESMYSLVQAYGQLAENLVTQSHQSSEIQQRLMDGTAHAERFMNDDMTRLFRQRATEATNSFYEECKDRFNELFKSAVRRYKQFTEAAMDFQEKMSGENERRVRAIESKLSMVEKVMYVLIGFAVLQTALLIVFKVL